MSENNTARTVIEAIVTAILAIAIFIGAIYLTITFGYLVGLLLGATPFISDWLVAFLPVDKTQIPGITAWLAVASLFIRGSAKVADKGERSE